MTTGEFDSNQALPTMEALQENVDLLMQQDALRAALYAPHEFLGPEAYTSALTPEVAQELSNVREYARTNIIRPELAARAASESAQRVATEVSEMLQPIETRAVDVSTEVGSADTKLNAIAGQLQGAMHWIDMLQQGIAYGQLPEQDGLTATMQLRDFAYNYGTVKTDIGSHYESAAAGAVQAAGMGEDTHEVAKRGANRTELAAEDARHEGIEGPDDVQAVADRAQPTIAEHIASCDEEVVGRVDGLREVVTQTGDLIEKATDLRLRINNAVDGVEMMPSKQVVDDDVEYIATRVRQLLYEGPHVAMYARDALEQFTNKLHLIATGVNTAVAANQRIAQATTELQSSVRVVSSHGALQQ